jgi:hypothetical protein
MGITLIFLAIIAIGIILYIIGAHYWGSVDIIGITLAMLGGIALAMALLAIILIQFLGPNEIIGYEQAKAKIEIAQRNELLTGEERSSAIDSSIKWNTDIKQAQLWGNNFFTSWFVYYPIAVLPQFDIEKINKANTRISQ